MNQMQKDLLCKNIKTYRKKLNITQEELAAKLGYTKQAISNWETGKNIPSDENIEEMAKVFGVNSNELMKKSDTNPLTPELECVEILPIPYKVNTYVLFFKDNVNDLWRAWLYDMDYPIMLFSNFACTKHDSYVSFKEDFLRDIDRRITNYRDFLDSLEINEYASSMRETKEMIEHMEAFADNPRLEE